MTTRDAPLPRSRLAAWPWHRLALGAVLALPCPGSGLAVTGVRARHPGNQLRSARAMMARMNT